ncbi:MULTISPECIES: SRPBCC family protein [unclassified Knoellia]|uniref:SRPBCC family protein n=1 Tax=Knoellia altitudinis TaxID=3404795 RepID=UPI00361FFF51
MFTLTRESPLPPTELWSRVAALAEHTETVPLTTTLADAGEPGVGWRFTVRTALGPLRFDDTMVVEAWDAPHRWRIRKTSRLAGWAQVDVTPYAGGSRLTWTEELWLGVPGLRRVTRAVGDLLGPLVFGRVVDRLVSERP